MKGKSMLTTITSILGLVTGVTALIVSWSNYMKDRPKVIIDLKLKEIKDAHHPTVFEEALVITITNNGRRPVYITQVGLQLTKSNLGYDRCLLVSDSTKGGRIEEGGPPIIHTLSKKDLEPLSSIMQDSRVIALDSRGKKYISQRIDEAESEVSSDDPRYATYVKSQDSMWLKLDELYKSKDAD
jgi:hypothetical protein